MIPDDDDWPEIVGSTTNICKWRTLLVFQYTIIIIIIIIIITIIIIIIITIIVISFMQGIYTYIPETNYVPRE